MSDAVPAPPARTPAPLRVRQWIEMATSVLLWTVVLGFTVQLTVDWVHGGRKTKTTARQRVAKHFDPPWLAWLPPGGGCVWSSLECTFEPYTLSGGREVINCSSAVEEWPVSLGAPGLALPMHILNATRLMQLGVRYDTLFDGIHITLILTGPDGHPANASRCRGLGPRIEALGVGVFPVVPFADSTIGQKLRGNIPVQFSDLGAYIIGAPSHYLSLSFVQSEETFLNGTEITRNAFTAQQFALPPSVGINESIAVMQVEVKPTTFLVTSVTYVEGESAAQLLANVFGWVGALAGASLHGIVVWLFTVWFAWRAGRQVTRDEEQLELWVAGSGGDASAGASPSAPGSPAAGESSKSRGLSTLLMSTTSVDHTHRVAALERKVEQLEAMLFVSSTRSPPAPPADAAPPTFGGSSTRFTPPLRASTTSPLRGDTATTAPHRASIIETSAKAHDVRRDFKDLKKRESAFQL